MMVFFFWLMVFVIFYTYVGYPVLLWIGAGMGKKQVQANAFQPSVTVLVAAYNEEEVIEEKIRNTLSLDYPAGLLKVVVIADGSADATVEKVKQFPDVTLLFEAARKGKAAAINRAMPFISSDIVVLTDANTFLDHGTIRELASYFADDSIGGVAGVKKVIEVKQDGEVGTGEGLYWKYESMLKSLEAQFYTVVGAAGELFALRRSDFVPISEAALTDDFYLSLSINLRNKRIAYASKAVATETPSATYGDEWKRKVRIAAGGFQSLILFKEAFNISKYPRLAFQFFSHRAMRWVACAPAFLFLFLINLVLYVQGAGLFYEYTLWMQVILYACALMGGLLPAPFQSFPIFSIPYYFVFMHAAMLGGAYRFFTGKQTVLWEKARRSSV